MERKKLIICQVLGILILVGFGAWLFVAFGGVSGQIACFLDQLDAMKLIKGKAGKEAGKIANLIPSSVTNLVRTYLPLIGVFVIVPAALISIIELLIVFCSANPCKNSRMDEVCAKLLILLLQIILVLGLVCYLVIGGAGIGINLPAAQSQLKMVTGTCDTGIPKLAAELTSAEAMLKTQQAKLDAVPAALAASVASAQKAVDDANFELGEAKKSVAALDAVCSCIKDTFTLLGSFIVPGLGCAVGCLILMLLNCAACCALGICGGKKKKAPAPSVEMSQAV